MALELVESAEFGVGNMETKLLEWQLTPWTVNGSSWKMQPVILIEGRIPFFCDHPDDYIEKLQEMHEDPTIARGPFFASIGQFKDALEQVWLTGGNNEKGISQ